MIYIFQIVLLFIYFSFAEKIPVVVVKVKKTTINQYYKSNGIIKSDKSIYIKPETSGKVVKLFVEEGFFVKKGQPLLAIESDKYDYQVLSQEYVVKKLKSIYNYRKSIFEKKKILYQKQLISEDEFSISKLNMETALQDLKSAEAKLKELKRLQNETIVKAPFDAVIDKRLVSEGELVSPGAKLLYLVDLTKLKVRFELPQRFIRKLHIGDTINVYVEGIGKLKGKISYISSSLTENSLIHYKADLEENELLKGNMYVVVKILESTIKGFKIPEVAVHMGKDFSFVYVVKNDVIEKRKIKIISQDYGYLVVDGDLKDGDLVVVSAPFGVKEGKQVYIEEIR